MSTASPTPDPQPDNHRDPDDLYGGITTYVYDSQGQLQMALPGGTGTAVNLLSVLGLTPPG